MTDDQQRKKIERRNVAIAETYEPGSIVKPLTVAAAVDMGLVTEDTTYSDDGPVNYSGAWINNWDGKHYGILNIVQLLQKSNNIGAAWVGHKVGSKNIYNYFSNFGLGTRTNIELEGEDSGILREYRNWTDIDLANISFGQGMSATPLQMLNAFNSLANGGFLLQPKIVSKIADNGKLIDIPTKIVRRVISKETSDTMVDMLQKAAEGGEAKYFVLKNYKVAGKTGTAQIPINGKYDLNKTNASFVGFLVGSKKFTMIVKFQEPRTSIYAAETAAPMWMDIAAELVKFYNLPPDKELSTTSR
jgi:cell division protein FtsI/penicillin-binding protein 2